MVVTLVRCIPLSPVWGPLTVAVWFVIDLAQVIVSIQLKKRAKRSANPTATGL